nr:hypothetical protein Iba_chr04dCG12550 [Ipomoea batatas]
MSLEATVDEDNLPQLLGVLSAEVPNPEPAPYSEDTAGQVGEQRRNPGSLVNSELSAKSSRLEWVSRADKRMVPVQTSAELIGTPLTVPGVAVLHMSDIEPVQKFVSCISDAHLAIRELEVDVKTLGNGFCQKCQNQLKEPHVCFYDADHVHKTEEVLFYVDKGVAVLHMSDIEPVQKFVYSCISDAHLAISCLAKVCPFGWLRGRLDEDHVHKTEEVLFYVDKVKKKLKARMSTRSSGCGLDFHVISGQNPL